VILVGQTMTTQRLIKLFALAAMIAGLAAIYVWRTTGDPPSPWLIRGSMSAAAAAFVLFMVHKQTRPRSMLQFLAALFSTIALFTFAADFSTARSTGTPFQATALIDRLFDFAPSLVTSAHNAIARTLGEFAWDPLLRMILDLPAFVVFMILAAICGFAGRPQREVRIFIN
jgi:hypothetical protein